MIGGISVSVTTGLGAAIVQTALGDNQVCCLLCDTSSFTEPESQFKYWFMYFLLVFVIVTLRKWRSAIYPCMADVVAVTEVYYLNVALALFNTGKYIFFTCCYLD
jgi:hypothetical protein